MKELPHTHSCFVCGESNAAGLRLRFETNGDLVLTRFIPGPAHVGFKQTVHGGLISAVLDEIMVWACAVQTKQFAYCAELKVRFLRPLRPNQTAIASGKMTADRRGKIFEAQSELQDQAGAALATATGKYMPVKKEDLRGLAEEFVGDASWLFGK